MRPTELSIKRGIRKKGREQSKDCPTHKLFVNHFIVIRIHHMEQQTNEVLFLLDGKKDNPGEQESCSLTVLKSKSSEYSERSLDQGIETVEILENVQVFPERQNVSNDSDKEVPTYSNLIMSNRPFRLYLASYLIASAGE